MSSILQLLGVGLIVAGVSFMFWPAGLIVAGAFSVIIGLAVRK
jgi:hypothetical protein